MQPFNFFETGAQRSNPHLSGSRMSDLFRRGIESNQVGTHELVNFYRRVRAEPFYGIKFGVIWQAESGETPFGNPTRAQHHQPAASGTV